VHYNDCGKGQESSHYQALLAHLKILLPSRVIWGQLQGDKGPQREDDKDPRQFLERQASLAVSGGFNIAICVDRFKAFIEGPFSQRDSVPGKMSKVCVG
jgi:hypothetical protein